MIKKICACFILISISFLILFLFVDVTKSSANEINKSFELYTEKDDSYPKGYYPMERGCSIKAISNDDRGITFSKSMYFHPERYSLTYPKGYSLLVKAGEIVESGAVLASNGNEKINATNKSRILKCEDGYLYLENLDHLEIVFKIEYDSRMEPQNLQFLTHINGIDHIFELKEYSFDESTKEYEFILICEHLSTDLLYGDTFNVDMKMSIDDAFIVPKMYVFFDDGNPYVKKYINTMRYGKLYSKEKVDIVGENDGYYFITGVSISDSIVSKVYMVYD